MRHLLLAFLLFSLCACVAGFEPIYAKKEKEGVADILNRVKFESLPNRSGQVLYTALYEKLKNKQSSAEPLYLLKVSNLEITQSNISIAADGTARLNQVLAKAVFTIEDAKTYTLIASFNLRLVSTYNVRDIDAYSSETAFQSARDRLLHNMAEQAKLRLIGILAKQEQL